MRLVTAKQMREMDRTTIEEIGVPSVALMETAGSGAAEVAIEMLDEAAGRSVVVVCGRGNNGGDGFVAARYLHNAGAHVTCLLAAKREELSPDAAIYARAAERSGIPIEPSADAERLRRALAEADLVVDALLGTGVEGEVREPYRSLIQAINDSGVQVLAVDLPSGLHSDTGQPLGDCVRADCTATFGLPKLGLAQYPGAELAGDVVVVDIGMPLCVTEAGEGPNAYLVTPELIAELLPERPADAHKGDCGKVLIVAGSPSLTGAAAMAAEAAARAGAGLVYLGVPAGLNSIFEAKTTEAMSFGLPETVDHMLDVKALDPIRKRLAECAALALGPGVGRAEATQDLVCAVLRAARVPTVLDADGLFALANDPRAAQDSLAPLVITPHPGEMARLLGCSVEDVQADRVAAARQATERFGAVTVLKGARSVICRPGGDVYVNPTGNPGMASGGMGDVLTGIIVALLGQGLEPWAAAVCGAYLHGLAGDLAAMEMGGEIGILASDLCRTLPQAIELALEGEELEEA